MIVTRKFYKIQDNGSYPSACFVLEEETSWVCEYDPETKSVVKGEPTGFTKTHIIVGSKGGFQILRFESDGKTLKSNPYAGVYLTLEEWRIVFDEMIKLGACND